MSIQLFKSILAGVGTGAGVAWPLFGLIFNALANPIASTTALVLGSISSSLFFIVAIPVAYFSYKQAVNEENNVTDKLNKNKFKLIRDINHYLASRGHDNVYLLIQKDIGRLNDDSSLQRVLGNLAEELIVYKQSVVDNKLLDILLSKCPSADIPFRKKYLPSVLNAVGTFGSIVGCYAGMAGVLTGLGLFATFTAFPFVGLGIIGIALACSVLTAFYTCKQSIASFHREHLIGQCKELHHQLLKATTEPSSLNALTHHAEKNYTNKITPKPPKPQSASARFFKVYAPTPKSEIKSSIDLSNPLKRLV